MTENPDILAELGAMGGGAGPFLMGFALETGSDAEVIDYAKQKLARKKADLVVANHASEALGKDDNRIHLVDTAGVESLEASDKETLASLIWDRVRARL